MSAQAEMFVYYLDVGEADAVIIRCDGHTLMIDGGEVSDSSYIYSVLRNTLDIEHIDIMIATHVHEDHIGGLPAALNACTVGSVYAPVISSEEGSCFSDLEKYATKQGKQIELPPVGKSVSLGVAEVQFLGPTRDYADANNTSIVVKIVYGETSFLFTGDMEIEAEYDLIENGIDLSADVLKVGHHGSDSSTSSEFLNRVKPSYSIISVGAQNQYGHPTEEVLSRLTEMQSVILRTDQAGTITCISDGQNITLKTEKEYAIHLHTEEPTITTEEPSLPEEQQSDAAYVGNRKSKKFHYAYCGSVSDMKESNKEFLDTREKAIELGYEPCKRCNP